MGEMIEIKANQTLPAYLVRPSGPTKAAIIVIHEVWGVDDHIKSVAERFAAEGYVALAPDFLSSAGIDTSGIADMQEALFDPERRNQIQPELRKIMAPMQNPEFGVRTTNGLKACFDYLYDLPESHQKVAVVGFCFGGTYSFTLAMEEPRLIAAIPFYGHADQGVEDMERIKCPVLAFYGENDERLISGLDELRQSMQAANVNFTAKVYPNCGHAFFNDTNRFAYNKSAAIDAWKLTLSTLNKAIF